MKFATTIAIAAPAARIWSLLTDAQSYPSWNITIDKIDGRIAFGEKITVHAKINPGRTFPVRVAEFVPCSRMVWSGGMPRGLFKGVRTFTLLEKDGQTSFEMSEVYSGPLSSLIERSLPDLQPAFDEFASALKKRAEGA